MYARVIFILCLFCVLKCGSGDEPAAGIKRTRCYDELNRPQRCIPEFENAAFNVLMEATNTCGERGAMEYCVQTGVTGIRKSCDICHPNQHHPRYLTDFHNQDNPTWWQSETMFEGIQWPNQVNLTLKFGKSFDITYIRIWFWSARPESFYLSKKTTAEGPWIPYQYYSATCRDTYGLPDKTHTTRGEESRALCTSEYSDISPLRGGNVAFGTLEGRPSAYNFDGSPELQEWVTATEIMITLDRINTFGDEVFGDTQVLKSYFYAIADIAVGARCKCNGHASDCIVASTSPYGRQRRICKCEHNTAGPDCNECLPFFNDVPWGRASARNARECKQCNCNGYSNRCYFDQKLYDQTGHGGHCLDCTANRDGPNCERCRENYYMREDGYCVSCECHSVGSRSVQCNTEGKCQCKPGVAGDKCDRCEVNSYDFSSYGCKTCGCSELGTVDNQPSCDPYSGNCYCKENVEGRRCRECKPGFFNLNADNKFGCTPCFCYGHSSECKSAHGFSKYLLESSFFRTSERWTAEDEYGRPVDLKYDPYTQSIGVQSFRDETIYFLAPNRYLGDQRGSYNQLLEFILRIGDNRPFPTATDVVLEGAGSSVSITISAQQNRIPTIQKQKYSFRLNEHPDYGWQPTLSSRAYMSILTNLTAIKIKGTYTSNGAGFLDDVKLETAARGIAGRPALWIESCDCPIGYVGQFCESCEAGFRHSPALGGSFMPCVPCDCNNHASICDSETGRCICEHSTSGENCELCARGYYGNALGGTPEDCRPCGCPNGGACIQIDEDIVMCTECPLGYTSHRCDSCSDGYYGDPNGRFAAPRPCRQCECNQNIDPNALGNCNTTTGECLKCVHNTAGRSCEMCLPGYYGNALVLPKGDCKQCQCYPSGTVEGPGGAPKCDQTTGACLCKNHVVGKNCDKCENGYYNLNGREGCQLCNCEPIGSLNQTCDVYTGQCYCRSGVSGLRCDYCESRKFGFSSEGCKDCNCDSIGSKDLQCDATGQCPCLKNVEGRKCDRCKENKYDRQKGCIDCPACYNLVQNETRTHTIKLNRLTKILDEIQQRPTVITDKKFPEELKKVQGNIKNLYDQTKNATGFNSFLDQVKDIRKREKDLTRVLSEVEEKIYLIEDKNDLATKNMDHADGILDEASEKLNEINVEFENKGKQALEEAFKRSEIVGQQSANMTEIAHKARHLADKIDKKADVTVATAKEAKNKSSDVYNQARNAVNHQAQISETVREVKNDVLNTELKLNKSKESIEKVSNKTVLVKNHALTLLSEVNNIRMPQIDALELKRKSDKLQEEAYTLLNKTEQLIQGSSDLRKNIDRQNHRGQKLLQKAEDQQEEINDLRNDLVFCESQADGAINLWNEILEGAENNYQLLAEFDSQTQKSRAEAEAALQTISEIESIINQILEETTSSQNSIHEAKKNANLALTTAIEADDLAKNVSLKAEYIKNEVEDLRKNSTALSGEADLMFDRVQNTEEELNNLLEMTRSNESLVNEAKEKVGRAGKDTDEVSKKVLNLLLDVEGIMDELQNSPAIDDGDIDRLEEEIIKTERRFKEAKLEEKLSNLQKEHKSQNDLINQFKNEIAVLQKEVDNIEEIVGALPEGCFKRLELEP